MKKKLFVPQIDNYISGLGNGNRNWSQNTFKFEKQAYKDIEEIFSLIKRISPVAENGCRELWFKAYRGDIEAWANYKELYDLGEVKNYEEYKNLWLDYYPNEEKWYHFLAAEEEKNKYRAIVINEKLVIEIDPRKNESTELHISEFTGWIIDQIKDSINRIKSGTYMDYVRKNLPVECKTGTILQSELWNIYPRVKEELFKGLTDTDISEFLSLIEIQDEETADCPHRLKSMTAGDFYRFCAIGYKAMDYKGCDKSPKEQYWYHADGRDDGLSEIDVDSAEEFEHWLLNDNMHIGHPFEVCRGGNSTHISLYPHKDEKGYFFRLAGSSEMRSNETMKFYLALCRAGIPVYLCDAEIMASRVKGDEKVGVVPQGVIPRYRQSDFPNENIISFMNLPYENTDRVAEKCVWQDIKEVHLLDI